MPRQPDDVAQRGKFGTYLTVLMRQRYWSQTDLAKRLGVDASQVSKWARGARTPDAAHCAAIAETFGIPAYEVLSMASRIPEDHRRLEAHPERERVQRLIERLDPEVLAIYADLMERHLAALERGA